MKSFNAAVIRRKWFGGELEGGGGGEGRKRGEVVVGD